MSNYSELEAKVLVWAKEKGILEKATPIAQCDKTFEEVEELAEALEAQRMGLFEFKNSKGKLVPSCDKISLISFDKSSRGSHIIVMPQSLAFSELLIP